MVQWIKILAAKPVDLRELHGRGELTTASCPLTFTLVIWRVCALTNLKHELKKEGVCPPDFVLRPDHLCL